MPRKQDSEGGQAGTAGVGRRAVTKSAALVAGLLLAGGGGSAAEAQARGRGPTGQGGSTGRGGSTGQEQQAGQAGARAGDDITVRLPAPTGPHRTGVTTLYLVDRSRRDPWEPLPVREVMVTACYPARAVHGYPVAPQMTEEAAQSFKVIDPLLHPGLPKSGVNWAATMSHSHTDAPAQTVPRPVLLHSPGGGDPRTLGTGLAEELASHGHVVVTIDHPGDASEVEFPHQTQYREKVRHTVFRGDPRTDPKIFRTAIDTRIADIRFVLDQLALLAAGHNPDAEGGGVPEDLGRALDLRRVGAYGHSAGGTAVSEALYEDRRIGAAVDLEGCLDHPPEAPGREGQLFPVARHGVDRPLLLMGTDGFPDPKGLERSWSAMLAHPRGHTHRRQLRHAAHWVFTDYAVMAPQLQAAGLMTAHDRNKLVGPIAPEASVPRVRKYVHTFFAEHLSVRG
ncbi:alpha/beta hydrolase family protein [Streptomyces halobius]|uniref:Alpha/beta hydrolase n=1 Tax=Streptomyces halobius TaxID=2879846 RepID=A0ABY4M4X0_9ACTN|nr:alpha/beta hydrolase [Streptomyces halobius]UQA92809.1 alpha/beta hydrolase [Streptomyces halobius]